MRLPFPAFGNTVAWRIFARFVLASLVPIAVLALLFYTEVSRSLERRALGELDDASRAIGQLVLDKLLAASDLLAVIEQQKDAAHLHAFGLDAVRYEREAGVAALGAVFDPPRLHAVDPAKPALLIRDGHAGAEVIIARALADGVVIGRVDRDYLRGAFAVAGSGTEACVFAESLQGEPVFCTGSALESLRTQIATPRAAGDFTWNDGQTTWLAAYWELFIPSRFDAQPWFVVVAEPRSAAQESLSMFQLVAPQTLVLSLVLSLLFAYSQIRRTLQPLNRLVAGTQRIAAQDFETRTGITGSDEFGSLGRAMDDMAERLGRQFGTLTTLAAIDRLILASDDIEQVLEAALARIAATFHGCDVAVLLTDASHDLRGRLYRQAGDRAVQPQLTRIELSSRQRAVLLACGEGRFLDEQSARADGFEAFGVGSGAAGVFVVPILRGQALGGALLVTLAAGPVDDRDFSLLGELAARLAVAVASSEREKALFQRAHFDSVTGMPNRQLCHDRLRQALVQARRDNPRVAVLFIDLDGFKNINDSLGHVAGDDLLKEMALRLTAAVRDADTVARLGGDEYVAILPHVQSTLEVDAVVTRVMATMQRPFVIHGRESVISGSVGVTIFPEDGATAEEMLRKADMAMYSAKAAGRSRCVYFTKELDQRLQERLALSSDLRRAVRNGELYLVYQPQVSMDASHVVSAEALLRWRHPTRGHVSPDVFVPIMEESGLIESVGQWVLQTALLDLAKWRAAGLSLPRIAVNIAARQVLAAGFADVVAEALRGANLEPRDLELELTETTLVQDLSLANACLSELAARGVRVAVDDFGTGYSSLGYLNELTFDALKIDRAFVVNLPAEKSVAIVKAIVAVAHALGKEVVAEGVETELQRAQLTKLNCDLAQGYLFSAPLESDSLARWLERAPLTPPALHRAASR
jgi:diguanylate cyclase (GGDEF)-like protein